MIQYHVPCKTRVLGSSYNKIQPTLLRKVYSRSTNIVIHFCRNIVPTRCFWIHKGDIVLSWGYYASPRWRGSDQVMGHNLSLTFSWYVIRQYSRCIWTSVPTLTPKQQTKQLSSCPLFFPLAWLLVSSFNSNSSWHLVQNFEILAVQVLSFRFNSMASRLMRTCFEIAAAVRGLSSASKVNMLEKHPKTYSLISAWISSSTQLKMATTITSFSSSIVCWDWCHVLYPINV